MNREKYLSEIADIFGIRASALRFWENEGLIKFERNQENNYREPTLQNLLTVCDILFLRSLSIPVGKIKTCFALPLEEISRLFEENEQTLSCRIEELQISLTRLKKKSAAIRRVQELKSRGHKLVSERLPAFRPFSFSEEKSEREFVSEYERQGIFLPAHCEQPQYVVFETNAFLAEKTYLNGLMALNTDTLTILDAPSGGNICGKYLITATENGVRQEFYEAFTEIGG